MIEAIGRLHDDIASYSNDHLGKNFPEAPATAEAKAYPDPEMIAIADSQGRMLVDVAADHLIAFTKTMTDPVQTFAPWVSVRGVLEASAIAAWIMDPTINSKERVGRSLALRHEGLSESVKFLRAAKVDQAEIVRAEKRIDEVEASAIRVGFTKVQDKNRKRIGIGRRMPSVTQLISQVFNEEPTYRLLSAMTHGHSWALQKLGYTIHEDDGVSSHVKLKQHVSPDSVGYLSVKTLRAFVRPVWYKSRRNGWDLDRLRVVLESAFNVMEINDQERFWRAEDPA